MACCAVFKAAVKTFVYGSAVISTYVWSLSHAQHMLILETGLPLCSAHVSPGCLPATVSHRALDMETSIVITLAE